MGINGPGTHAAVQRSNRRLFIEHCAHNVIQGSQMPDAGAHRLPACRLARCQTYNGIPIPKTPITDCEYVFSPVSLKLIGMRARL